ncbi:MAG: hypothetical protein HOW73_31010 [Polyangiaceae bacterium]|nr:hypothetical protein [Polyangiaceae bacterium]
MSRLPSIDPRSLRDHADDARVDRIWDRLRDELPAPRSSVTATPVPGALLHTKRPAVARTVFLFAAAAAMFGTGLVIGSSNEPEQANLPVATPDGPMTDVFAAGTKPRTFALPGGGRIVVEPGSTVEVVSVSDERVNLSLLRGAASLDAVDIPVDVVAGVAHVSAPAGSSVSLARREADLDVLVAQGTATVTSPAGQQVVRGGHVLSRVPIVATVTSTDQRADVPPPVPVPVNDADPDARAPAPSASQSLVAPTSSADPAPVAATTVAAPEAPATWLSLVKSDKYEAALELLEKGPGLQATINGSQSASELWYLWEVAATGKKDNLKVLALRRVVDEFGSDPSAAAAALQLAQFYEPTDKQLAAKYREKAAQTKGLAEVALCSQVRAMASEGDDVDPRRATQKATEYLTTYPMGSCADDAKALLQDVAGKFDANGHAKDSATKKDAPASPPSASAPAAPPSASDAPAAPSSSASAAPSATPSATPKPTSSSN